MRILREPAVLEMLGLGASQLDEAVKRGEFPAPIKLTASGRAKGWFEHEVLAHIETRRAARDKEATKKKCPPSARALGEMRNAEVPLDVDNAMASIADAVKEIKRAENAIDDIKKASRT
jgi:predicted DNA-binding transcriptional regulator AlpA